MGLGGLLHPLNATEWEWDSTIKKDKWIRKLIRQHKKYKATHWLDMKNEITVL